MQIMGTASRGPARAALQDRGGGLLYDKALNVTWLQDANFAKPSGHSPSGKMSWTDAVAWVTNLVYRDAVRNVDLRGGACPGCGRFAAPASTADSVSTAAPMRATATKAPSPSWHTCST